MDFDRAAAENQRMCGKPRMVYCTCLRRRRWRTSKNRAGSLGEGMPQVFFSSSLGLFLTKIWHSEFSLGRTCAPVGQLPDGTPRQFGMMIGQNGAQRSRAVPPFQTWTCRIIKAVRLFNPECRMPLVFAPRSAGRDGPVEALCLPTC